MASRDLTEVRYLPLLDVRPAELVALEELPNKDKDAVLPLFKLRPWVGAKNLNSAINRLGVAYGRRPCFLELGDPEPTPEARLREVHAQLQALRDPAEGYKNWVRFLKQDGNEHFIPVVQLGAPEQVPAQIESLMELERGLLVHIDVAQVNSVTLAKFIAQYTSNGVNTVVLLDFFKQNSEFLTRVGEIRNLVEEVLVAIPRATLALSASSFPDGFTSLASQDIFERIVFDQVAGDVRSPLIYSDRGSARAERQAGGGGLPAPRIDFAKPKSWVFFRQDTPLPTAAMGYQRQATALMDSEHWDAKLKLWGCQMIQKTAIGDDTGITSPNRATAARINIHLHQQLWYGNIHALYDTDEDWTE